MKCTERLFTLPSHMAYPTRRVLVNRGVLLNQNVLIVCRGELKINSIVSMATY